MMQRQVITLQHFYQNTEDRAQNHSHYFIPPIIWLAIFATIVRSAVDATAKFAILTASATALIFYYIYLILGVLSASSLVIARYIGKFESNPIALIFWLSLLMTLGAAVDIWDQNMSLATQSFEFFYLIPVCCYLDVG
jgi:hypothetical protein